VFVTDIPFPALRAYPIVEHQKGSSIGKVPALQTDIELGWKGLPWTDTLTYYEHS
jgi:hypothetical protein